MAPPRELFQMTRLQRKRILLRPAAVRINLLYAPPIPALHHPERPRRIALLNPGAKPQRLKKQLPETHIRKPSLVQSDARGGAQIHP